MRITVLVENICENPLLCAEHGLSLYIETQKHKILFDFGQSERCIDNAEKLGIHLEEVDFAFLSHGHFDHSGAMRKFLQLNHRAPVYLSDYAFERHYNQDNKYIGIDSSLMDSSRLVFAHGSRTVDDELTILNFNHLSPGDGFQTFGMTKVLNGVCVPDTFHHEQYLLVTEGENRVLFSGCSHKGVENILTWARAEEPRLNILVGGFHFFKITEKDYGVLEETAQRLVQLPIQYYTGHCTGTEQYRYLKQRMGDCLHYMSTGTTVEI